MCSRGDWSVGAFRDDFGFDQMRVGFVDNFLHGATEEYIAFSVHDVFSGFGARESFDSAVVELVSVELDWVDTVVVPETSVPLDDSDDFGAGSFEVPGGVKANVTESLYDNRFSSETGGESYLVHEESVVHENIGSVEDASAGGAGSTVDTSLRDWFAGDASFRVEVAITNSFRVLVSHPSHFSLASSHIRGWDIDGWSEKTFFSQFSGESSSDFFEFGFGVFFRVDADTGFSTAEWNVDDRAFPGHQSSQSFNFVFTNIQTVPHTTFGRKSMLRVLGSVSNDVLVATVISRNREINLDNVVTRSHGSENTSDFGQSLTFVLISSLFSFDRVHQRVGLLGFCHQGLFDEFGGFVVVDFDHFAEGRFIDWARDGSFWSDHPDGWGDYFSEHGPCVTVFMLMMRSDLLFLSDEEVLTSLDAYKKSLKNKIKVKDENPTITIPAYSGKLYTDYG